MAFFVFTLKAAFLNRKIKKYEDEKGMALDEYLYGIPRQKKRPRKKKLVKKLERSSIGGVLLTYIYLFFFIFGLRFPLRATTYVCIVFGIICCLGLAFSRKVRCYVLLMIPVFFSKQGRQVLLSYALFLAVTGPLKNTLDNIGILSDSLNCGQEMLKKAMKQIEDMIKAPFRAMKETLRRIVQTLKDVLQRIKDFLSNIKRIILGILNVIKKALSWLGSIINFCNKKLGTPFQRCMKTFDDAIEDCKAKMGIMDFLCHVVHVVRALCYTVKFLDLICLFKEFVSENIIGVVKTKLKEFSTMVKAMFYVSIEFSHSYEYNVEASNTTKEVVETLLQKFAEKFEHLNKFLNWLGWAFSFIFIYIFFRVYYYKHKYMSSDRYDNRYITKHIMELDLRRLQMNKETVLPLEFRERKHFCRPTSLRLLRDEQTSILNTLLALSLSTLEIACFVASDYCLYWVLFTIYTEGHREYAEVEPGEVELYITGKGALADFYRKLGKVLKVPKNVDLQLNPVVCLPDPIPPDKDRYIQIAFLTGICWVLAVTEAYGLRLRGIVMSHYYPERAKERAVWLYNHILRTRGNFLRFARRQLRRKMLGGEDEPTERVTLKDRLFAAVPILGMLFGTKREDACLLCGAPGSEKNPLIKCRTPGCVGKYCMDCYSTLNNTCTVCQNPIEYGDVSDISEERDSSEEDEIPAKIPISEEDTNFSTESEDTTTFRDMETRPKFRDVERNNIIDLAQTSDFRREDSDSEPPVELGKLLNTNEAYQLMRKKTSSLLVKLRNQRAAKLQALKSRKMKVMNALKKRLREKKRKMSGGDNARYETLVQKARVLTRILKAKTSGELLVRARDWNKENELEPLLNIFDNDNLRRTVLEKMKRSLSERRERSRKDMEVNVVFNRERKPYSGVFPTRSDSITSLGRNGPAPVVQYSIATPEMSEGRPQYYEEQEVFNTRQRRNTTVRRPVQPEEEKKFTHLR